MSNLGGKQQKSGLPTSTRPATCYRYPRAPATGRRTRLRAYLPAGGGDQRLTRCVMTDRIMTSALAASEPSTTVRFTWEYLRVQCQGVHRQADVDQAGRDHFNCPGGEPRAAMRLFDFIQEAQNITTVSRGYAALAGISCSRRADARIIGSEGYLMIKNPALWMPDEEYLAEFADRVEKVGPGGPRGRGCG